MTAIETTGLTKRYGDTTAVADISLTVETGEIYGFLGPNGAGKSTTIDLLMDYRRPTAGQARILGFDSRREREHVHANVGVLPDGFEPYPDQSARAHLELAIDTLGSGEEPVSLLEQVGLAEAIDDPAGSFSRGMTQRLGLALALVGDPDVLVLDEPFQGLDPRGVATFRDLVQARNADGTTVFFLSHVLGEVELVCDRLGILDDGRLVAEGSADELRETAGLGPAVHLTVDEQVSTVRPALESHDAVMHVSPTPAGVRVQLDRDGDPDAVRATVRDHDLSIRSTRTEPASVESVFLALTEKPADTVARQKPEVSR